MNNFNNGFGSYQSPSLGMQQATPFAFNMFDTELMNRTIDIPNPNAPVFSGTSQPKFSDMGSLLTPASVGQGTVLSAQPTQQMLPQMNPSMFAPSTPVQTPVSSPVPVQQVTANPAVTGVTPQVTPSPATATPIPQMFSSMYGGDPSKAYTTEALALNTAPSVGVDANAGFMDMFGLGDMTTKDLLTGAAGAAQLGLGAYGMFKGLDQADTRLNQGQQALDLSREEYDENLRHRQAIVSQNKGA